MAMRIYCPKCGYEPPPQARWVCHPDGCGHVWNTFATHGICPRCKKMWPLTSCPRCQQWSPHDNWYHDDISQPKREKQTTFTAN